MRGRRLRRGFGVLLASDRRGLLGGPLRPGPARALPTPGRPLPAPGRPLPGPSRPRVALNRLGLVSDRPGLGPGRPGLAPSRRRHPPARLRFPRRGRRLGSHSRWVRSSSGTPPHPGGLARPGVALAPRPGVPLRSSARSMLHCRGRCGRGNLALRLERPRRRAGPTGVAIWPGRRGRWRLPASRARRAGVLLGRGRDRLADGLLPARSGRTGPGVGVGVAGRHRRRLRSTVAGTRWRSGLAWALGREPPGQRRGRAGLLRTEVRRRVRPGRFGRFWPVWWERP
jgi:hypothetical protein